MPSLIPGFEYDIFISYRQKDNKGEHWVTEFVNALKAELEATFKEDISIYFDENPHDGLHETHDVSESLASKLKSVVFIPIISQTYCDPASYAWKNEFLAFRDLATSDPIGLKVHVANGNVTSRILPIRIHDLDAEDVKLFESETGGPMRSVDFIFNSGGVNRPLIVKDDIRSDNSRKVFYRDQINKVASSVKEIIAGLKRTPPPGEAAEKQPQSHSRADSALPANTNRRKNIIGAAAILILAITAYSIYSISNKENNPSEIVGKSIAVLPFSNLSQKPDEEYFSDGITEDIIAQISKVADLKVIARSSVMRYKNTNKDIVDIGKELGVDAILEGTVRLSSNRVRITANLSSASSRQQLWAETYDRDIQDIFSVQSDVAKEIVTALKANFSSNERKELEKRPTKNMEAYDLYLKSKYNFAKGKKAGYSLALAQIIQAVELDGFAQAYTQLAMCYSLVSYYAYIPDVDLAKMKAREAATKALELDPSLADAHDAMGYILRTQDWNWNEAEKEFKKALSLNPNSSSAHRRYALLLACTGRIDDALKEANFSFEIDPLGSLYNADMARMYYYAGQFDRGIILTKRSFDLEPGDRLAMGLLGCILEQQGMLDSSVVMISRSATRSGTDYEGVQEQFDTKPTTYGDYWQGVLKRTIEDRKKQYIPNIVMAILYMRVNDKEKALDALKAGYKAREGGMVYVNAEPLFKPLRKDPRFQEIVRSMGLKPD